MVTLEGKLSLINSHHHHHAHVDCIRNQTSRQTFLRTYVAIPHGRKEVANWQSDE